MAQKKTLKDLFSEIGTYKEAAGGGTPIKKGEHIDHVADTAKEAQAYRAQHPGSVVRVNQPRDKDGQFTYNSANAKTLEYGPSRGTTTPPFLLGKEISFASKSGKGSIIFDGKRYAVKENFATPREFAEAFTQYFEDEGFKKIGKLEDKARGKGGKIGKTEKISSRYLALLRGDIDKNIPAVKGKKVMYTKNTDDKEQTKSKGGIDYSLAKSNPEKFINDNFDELQSIVDMASKKGYDIDVDDMVQNIANGNLKDFDEIKDTIKRA